MLGAIVIDATYGYQIKSGEDNMIDLFEEVMRDFAEGIAPGSHLVDLMPWRMSQYLIIKSRITPNSTLS
jgi:hypothetical protein